MATLNHQCMVCDSIYKTSEMETDLEIEGKPAVSHGYCSEECYKMYLKASGFGQEDIEEFTEGITFDQTHSVNPVGIEQVIEKMQRNSEKHK